MYTIPIKTIEIPTENSCIPEEILRERVKALYVTKDMTFGKERANIIGEIKYLENLILEKEFNNEYK